MQIVGYRPATDPDEHARLLLARDGSVRQEPLVSGTELRYTLGERHCAGKVTENRHTPCQAAAPYCDRHTSKWACARCRGECKLPLQTCREEHAVYLAAFAPATFKVGVTRSWRLQTRLYEQGADRGAHLRTVENGRIARQIESEIATDVGDRVRVPAKIEGLHRPVDEDAWQRLLAAHDHESTLRFEYGIDLPEQPLSETIASGTVCATKGRVLVLRRDSGHYAVDLRELVGHEVTGGETDQTLQSSFAAFE